MRRTWEVRERVIALTVGLATLALIAAGVTLWIVEQRTVRANMTATLQRTAEEFRTYTESAVDPVTGQPFTDPSALLYSAMGNEVAAENDLSRRLPVRGNDDVAELARSFNGMVDRLEGAFAGQR